MSAQTWVKTIYFDGFAGSGVIEGEGQKAKKGTALRIMDIVNPKSFDIDYFVELKGEHKNELEQQIRDNYPGRKSFVVKADCNDKLVDLAEYLKENKAYRALSWTLAKNKGTFREEGCM